MHDTCAYCVHLSHRDAHACAPHHNRVHHAHAYAPYHDYVHEYDHADIPYHDHDFHVPYQEPHQSRTHPDRIFLPWKCGYQIPVPEGLQELFSEPADLLQDPEVLPPSYLR